MNSTSWLRWTISAASRSRREPGSPSCVTETVRGSSPLSGASRTGSLSARHQVHSAAYWPLEAKHRTSGMDNPARGKLADDWCFPGIICLGLCSLDLVLSRAGYQGPDFDWADYLKQCEAEAAPQQCFPTVSLLLILAKISTGLFLCQPVSHSLVWDAL